MAAQSDEVDERGGADVSNSQSINQQQVNINYIDGNGRELISHVVKQQMVKEIDAKVNSTNENSLR
jgi:hypothetical protein